MLPREDLFAAPTTPRPRHKHAVPRTSFYLVAAHRYLPNPKGRRGLRAARGRALASVPSAPSNMRLELAAPGG